MFKIGNRVKYVDITGDDISKFSTSLKLGNIYTITEVDRLGCKLKEVNNTYHYSLGRFILAPLLLHKNIRVL
jgi:hypothetical protein